MSAVQDDPARVLALELAALVKDMIADDDYWLASEYAAAGAALARTLLDFAGRSYPASMCLAGSMLVKYGDMARTRNMDGRLMDELSDTEQRVDALLAMAGVPAAVQLEVV